MRHHLLPALLLLSVLSLPLRSAEAAPQRHAMLEVELVAEVTSVQPGQPFWAGVRFKMDPHWHVYWLNPGDSGLAPYLTWALPEGATAGEIQWPYPEAITVEPLTSFGYEGEVLFPVEITPPADLKEGDRFGLALEASWLVCKEECIPGDADLRLELPVVSSAPEPDPAWTGLFAKTRERLPLADSGWQAGFVPVDAGWELHLLPPDWFEGELKSIHFFPYQADVVDASAAQALRREGAAYVLTLERAQFQSGEVEELTGVVVSPQGWRGADSEHAIAITATPGSPDPDFAAAGSTSTGSTGQGGGGPPGGAGTLFMALLFAFLGGMILNLMPCVLPVLSLKIFNFVKHAGESRRVSLNHGLVFTAGVWLSFLVLAGVLIMLRAGGEELGLGFHLQSPVFVLVLSAFLFLFALSLLGVFEIGASLTGVGGAHQTQQGYSGSFLNGVTATIVATPCTAPFMGAALGFALTQPAMGILAIFSAIGLGMACPYVVLAANPALLRFVPKPGPWMETFKQFMGFLLFATIVWLAWVLGLQTGANGVIALLATLLLLGLGAWVLQRFAPVTAAQGKQRAGQLAAALVMIAGLALGWTGVQQSATGLPGISEAKAATHGSAAWEPWSEARVAELMAQGKPVFIDFTAAWCLSCQVNKKVALQTPEVLGAFRDQGVTLLMADWTKRDPAITQGLAAYGRNSVPVYVLINAQGQTTLLPEILTPAIVLDALANLEG